MPDLNRSDEEIWEDLLARDREVQAKKNEYQKDHPEGLDELMNAGFGYSKETK